MVFCVLINAIIAAYSELAARSDSECTISGEITIADDQLTGVLSGSIGNDSDITLDYAVLGLVVGGDGRIG